MVASAIAQVLEDVIREPDVVQLAPDERVPLLMASGIVKCIGGDIDQAGLDQVERRIEEGGDRPVEELALVPELLIQPEVMTRPGEAAREVVFPRRSCGGHPVNGASRA